MTTETKGVSTQAAATIKPPLFAPLFRCTETDEEWKQRCSTYVMTGAALVRRLEDDSQEFLGPSKQAVQDKEAELKGMDEKKIAQLVESRFDEVVKKLLDFAAQQDLACIRNQKTFSPALKLLMADAFELDQAASKCALIDARKQHVTSFRFPTYPLVLNKRTVSDEHAELARMFAAREGLREVKVPALPSEDELTKPSLSIFIPTEADCKTMQDAFGTLKGIDLYNSVTKSVVQGMEGIFSVADSLAGEDRQVCMLYAYELQYIATVLTPGLLGRRVREFPLKPWEIIATIKLHRERCMQAAVDIGTGAKTRLHRKNLADERRYLARATATAIDHINRDRDLALRSSDDSHLCSSSTSSIQSSDCPAQ